MFAWQQLQILWMLTFLSCSDSKTLKPLLHSMDAALTGWRESGAIFCVVIATPVSSSHRANTAISYSNRSRGRKRSLSLKACRIPPSKWMFLPEVELPNKMSDFIIINK